MHVVFQLQKKENPHLKLETRAGIIPWAENDIWRRCSARRRPIARPKAHRNNWQRRWAFAKRYRPVAAVRQYRYRAADRAMTNRDGLMYLPAQRQRQCNGSPPTGRFGAAVRLGARRFAGAGRFFYLDRGVIVEDFGTVPPAPISAAGCWPTVRHWPLSLDIRQGIIKRLEQSQTRYQQCPTIGFVSGRVVSVGSGLLSL